mgnify:FL=1|jgi:hypothetical protein
MEGLKNQGKNKANQNIYTDLSTDSVDKYKINQLALDFKNRLKKCSKAEEM